MIVAEAVVDPTVDAVSRYILSGVVGTGIIFLLYQFIKQVQSGLWVTRWQYDQMVTMKDVQIKKLEEEVAGLSARLDRVDTLMGQTAATMNQVIGAAVRTTNASGKDA